MSEARARVDVLRERAILCMMDKEEEEQHAATTKVMLITGSVQCPTQCSVVVLSAVHVSGPGLHALLYGVVVLLVWLCAQQFRQRVWLEVGARPDFGFDRPGQFCLRGFAPMVEEENHLKI